MARASGGASSVQAGLRLYGDLSWVWPLIATPDDYAEETRMFAGIIQEHAQIEVASVLSLGCGAGLIDRTLKQYFEVTGVDISADMLARARQLNPDVEYHAGDMRSVRLERTFDAVTILDSIDYMVTERDLKAALATAFVHLKPGGAFTTLPETKRERFHNNATSCEIHSRDGVEIAFVENVYDPDPNDTSYEATFVFLIRRQGRLKIETDRHVLGLFSTATWHRLLREAGFEATETEFLAPGEPGGVYPLFVGVKPLAAKPRRAKSRCAEPRRARPR